MKKISIVSLASFVFLLLCSTVAVALKNAFSDALNALIVGVVILIVSGVLAFVLKGKSFVRGVLITASHVKKDIKKIEVHHKF